MVGAGAEGFTVKAVAPERKRVAATADIAHFMVSDYLLMLNVQLRWFEQQPPTDVVREL